MSRRRRHETGPFAMLPVDVLTSAAARTLPHIAHRVVVALAAQYTGRNNGSLSMTRADAAKFGIRNAHALFAGLRELEDRGLIVKTRPGSRTPPRSAFYAVTWRRMDAPLAGDPHDAKETLQATEAWSKWQDSGTRLRWTAKRRISRWPVHTRSGDASIPEKAKIGGACTPDKAVSPVARVIPSHISARGGR